jgi:hypothetical protein
MRTASSAIFTAKSIHFASIFVPRHARTTRASSSSLFTLIGLLEKHRGGMEGEGGLT